MNDVYLKNLTYPESKDLINTWAYVQVGEETRLYFKPDSDGNGFKFYATSWLSTETDFNWDLNSVTVECLLHGIAYWDGIRHLYFGDERTDNYGYHYYPHIVSEHIACLKELRKLEEKFCKEFEE